MIATIEYLLIAILLTIFSENNISNVIYITSSIIISFIIFIVNLIILKKQKKKSVMELDYKFIIILLMIVVVNIVCKIEIYNIYFAYTLLIIYLFKNIKTIVFDKKLLQGHFVSSKHLFDIYSIYCLLIILMRLLSYEV